MLKKGQAQDLYYSRLGHTYYIKNIKWHLEEQALHRAICVQAKV